MSYDESTDHSSDRRALLRGLALFLGAGSFGLAATVSLSLAGIYFYEGAQFHQLVDRALSNLLFYHPADLHE